MTLERTISLERQAWNSKRREWTSRAGGRKEVGRAEAVAVQGRERGGGQREKRDSGKLLNMTTVRNFLPHFNSFTEV